MNLKKMLLIVFIIVSLFFLVTVFTNCKMSAPTREDFNSEEAYLFCWCMFINQQNPDKSICKDFVKIVDEKSRFDRATQIREICKKEIFKSTDIDYSNGKLFRDYVQCKEELVLK